MSTIKLSPCYKCEERHKCCHASCDKYKAYKETMDNERIKVTSAREADNRITTHVIEMKTLMNKRKGR